MAFAIINITHQNDKLFFPQGWLYPYTSQSPSPQFTLRFTHVVHSVGFNKSTVTYIHHYNIKVIFHCPKNPLCSAYSMLSPLHWSFYCLHSFVYSRMYKHPRAGFRICIRFQLLWVNTSRYQQKLYGMFSLVKKKTKKKKTIFQKEAVPLFIPTSKEQEFLLLAILLSIL